MVSWQSNGPVTDGNARESILILTEAEAQASSEEGETAADWAENRQQSYSMLHPSVVSPMPSIPTHLQNQWSNLGRLFSTKEP